ncbi:MAG: bacteriohemerythrin [Candidatus Thiodiazotropha sp. (ex Lucina aurantia)]|uniref:Bacteriohemerythrin n=1 Tax=Candidatus Thiodiazotropha taylori TaxID=2792791 RepID=A0A9E4MV01_9GAMM|nr:bacteriohemerythrin [Candidatus Thiodiazotropha sp. (ex Lucina pensylvanica)]MBT3016617.1 bacteriohemerythrin [Candidatus Thiodiazotropha taylori]MBT3044483.1 bacteriohemerythrin [Candidatus Thiodiazotropha sp. (ex Codakia orbicularis)]MBV2104756.1 bacteriohemerythrin [Candidatus Thiodiazotropha sp. (ex Lucina aurantia)]MCG7864549.1 bacteriohemerythrin [Candidatus Thiodiazotropha endolucinida]
MKRFLTWRDDWYLGIDEIDQQHLHLVELINQVADSVMTQNSESNNDGGAMRLVLQLQEETRQHFRDEEAFMRNHEYPQVSSHHREHALLQAELSDLIREIEEGKRRLDIETLTSLKYWLIDHVIESDMDIARYMNSR